MFDFVSFIPRAIAQSIPLLFGSTGEIITEKSGNLNLGIPGVMYVGGICGVIFFFFSASARLSAGCWSASLARREPGGGFGVALSQPSCRTYRVSCSPTRPRTFPSHPDAWRPAP